MRGPQTNGPKEAVLDIGALDVARRNEALHEGRHPVAPDEKLRTGVRQNLWPICLQKLCRRDVLVKKDQFAVWKPRFQKNLPGRESHHVSGNPGVFGSRGGNRLGHGCQSAHLTKLNEARDHLLGRDLLLVHRIEIHRIEKVCRGKYLERRQLAHAARVRLALIGQPPSRIERAAHRGDRDASQQGLESRLGRDRVDMVDRLQCLCQPNILSHRQAQMCHGLLVRQRFAVAVQHVGMRLVDNLGARVFRRRDHHQVVVVQARGTPQEDRGVVFDLPDHQNALAILGAIDRRQVNTCGLVVFAQSTFEQPVQHVLRPLHQHRIGREVVGREDAFEVGRLGRIEIRSLRVERQGERERVRRAEINGPDEAVLDIGALDAAGVDEFFHEGGDTVPPNEDLGTRMGKDAFPVFRVELGTGQDLRQENQSPCREPRREVFLPLGEAHHVRRDQSVVIRMLRQDENLPCGLCAEVFAGGVLKKLQRIAQKFGDFAHRSQLFRFELLAKTGDELSRIDLVAR